MLGLVLNDAIYALASCGHFYASLLGFFFGRGGVRGGGRYENIEACNLNLWFSTWHWNLILVPNG